MDKNMEVIMRKRINRVIENLKDNNIEGFFVEDNRQLIELLKELVKEESVVAMGGSMTLFESGVVDFIKAGNYNFLDRYREGITPGEIKEVYRKSFSADYYLSSSNALLESGELYNVDGNGNRVAAMIYGPDKVIVIVGQNKIVKDFNEAEERNRNISAPANCIRLNKKTPCAEMGYCMNCRSKDRICNDFVLIKRQGDPDRMKVIIVGQDLGY